MVHAPWGGAVERVVRVPVAACRSTRSQRRAAKVHRGLRTLVARLGFSPEHYDDLEHRAIHHLKSLLGLTVDVVVRPPGTFERSTGKAVRVRDLRPKLH